MRPVNRPSARGFARIEEVIATLVRHGLDAPALDRSGTWRSRASFVWRRLTGRQRAHTPWPLAVRNALIELGPAFIKLGQILSVRSDLIPVELADALRTLQEDVPAVPFEDVRRQIELALGVPLEAAFLSFDPVPLAAGSIAQVHQAVMASGRRVAVKVKRPGIDAMVQRDLEVVTWLAARLERFLPAARRYHALEVAEELARYTHRELDFRQEADVARRLREHFAAWPLVRIPEIVLARTSMLVMEYIQTFPVTDLVALARLGIDREQVVKVAVNAVLSQIYDLGVFHGDPHPGNMRVSTTGELVFLDFGISGELSERIKHCMLSSAIHAAHGEIEASLVYLLELARPEHGADPAAFRHRVAERFERWRGASAQEYGFGQLVYDQITLGAQHGLRFPPDAVLFTKALVTLEGVALEVAPELYLSREAIPFFDELARRKYSWVALTERIAWAVPRWVELLEHAPVAGLRRVDRWLRTEGELREAKRSSNAAPALFGGLALVAGAVLLVGATPTAWHGMSALGGLMMLSGLLVGGRSIND